MRYVAIDIETTGLDRERDQILQVAMVAEEQPGGADVSALDYFEGLVWHERLSGHPFALDMNAEIVAALAGVSWAEYESQGSQATRVIEFRGRTVNVYRHIDFLVHIALQWLRTVYGIAAGELVCHRVTAAGKNAAGFDLPFLPLQLREAFHHRVIDVGSLALGAMTPEEWAALERVPGLSELHDGPATHDALEDARDVVRIIRKVLRDRG